MDLTYWHVSIKIGLYQCRYGMTEDIMANTSIWIRLITHNRITADTTVPCPFDKWKDALEEGCHQLDIPRPLVIDKHERDWESFSQTRFLPDHFIESVSFDRMEVEFINPEAKKKINEKYL